jgi:Tfp pilus assembly protein PilN
MIEINLLPGARRKTKARSAPVNYGALFAGLSGRFQDKVLIGTVALSIASLGALGWMYWSQTQAATAYAERLAKAQKDSAQFETLFIERNLAEATRDTALRQLNLIKTVDQDRFIWPHVLDEVSRALPGYTWLTLVSFVGTAQGTVNNAATPPLPKDTGAVDPKRPRRPKRIETAIPPDPVSVRVTGKTYDILAVPELMRRLEDSPFLGNVTLDRSDPLDEQGQILTTFQLTMTFVRPDTSQLRRVPFTLKGKK